MALHETPLKNAQPASVSVCGKLLTNGQTVTVLKSAIGPRERTAEARGKISIRESNKKTHVQVTCTLVKPAKE